MYGEKSKGEVLKVQFGMQRVRASTQKATRGRDERVTERPECLGKDFECEIKRPNIWKEFPVSVNPLLDLLVILASPRATFRSAPCCLAAKVWTGPDAASVPPKPWYG